MKDTILGAAIDVIALHGLNNWTVEEVANRAHCAKGLVNYHYRSKQDLLARSAETLRDDRFAKRLAAIGVPGSAALDRLWVVLVQEVESGWFAAWLSLLASDGPLRISAAERPEDTESFAKSLSRSLGLGDQLGSQAALIQSSLDGIQLRLLQGFPAATTEEAYHRFWLGALA
ncbi:MAG TPA: helix-turn-helix domain-containing protein [Gemmatimonadales bacterium]|nr:helix-turn-helix domain-containing protein [Gemmatimonadales bacterium]